MKSLKEHVKYTCQLISEAHRIPVYYVNANGDLEYEFAKAELQKNPFYRPIKEQLSIFCGSGNLADFPLFFSNSFLHFFMIKVHQENVSLGKIIVGPTIETEMSEKQITQIMDLFKGYENKRNLIDYYRTVAVIPREQLLAISKEVYYMIYQKRLEKTLVKQRNSILEPKDMQIENADLELSKGRRDFIFPSNLYYERVLLKHITNGRIDKLADITDYSIVGEAALGILSKRSRLQSEKNLMITAIALICRAAIKGGLNEETAFTLSDFYIQQLEELRSLQEILNLVKEVIYDFTKRVHQLHKQKYSAPITACLHYIYNNLYNDISLVNLSRLCHLSSNYLSSIFKKEVGMSIRAYIQKQRIDEAKKLIILTNYAISDIANWLNFTDQSYFIKVFKKHTGMTPKQFKHNHPQEGRK